jgi:methionyl-tRNA formyltransferase
VPIDADMTAGELHDILARMGAELMPRALGALERDTLEFKPQPNTGVTYADKISKDETRIDWSKPAKPVHDHIRGLSPFPGAWFEAESTRIKVLRSTLAQGSGPLGTVLDDQLTVACGEGAVRLLELQRAGRQAMPAEEFLRGAGINRGARLT